MVDKADANYANLGHISKAPNRAYISPTPGLLFIISIQNLSH
jgi:hypothetical protein